MNLKEKSIKILEILAIFKFLSTSQIITLNIAKHKPNLVGPIKDLIFYNLIGKITFWVDPKKGKLENVYYLKIKWVKFLKDELNYDEDIKIKYPIWTNSLFFRDYFHRLYTIQFHIKLFIYLVQNNWTIRIFDTYFDKTWSNRIDANLKAKTKLIFKDGSYFIPDAICLYEKENKPYIVTFEIYRGKDTKRVLKQFIKHLNALSEWLPSKVFNKKIGSKVVALFDTKEAMISVIKRFRQDSKFHNFDNFFIFNYLEDWNLDMNTWLDCYDNKVIL